MYSDRSYDFKDFFKNMVNYVEDRRIDNIVFKSSPGYKGYYHTLYSKFFNHKTIGKGLKSKEYRGADFESYLFRIINFTNPDTVLDALPRLKDIYRVIDMKNISRLKSTEDAINVAKTVCEIVFKIVKDAFARHIDEALEKTKNSFFVFNEGTRFEKLHTVTFDNSEIASNLIAREICDLVKLKQDKGKNCVLGFATGSSPTQVFLVFFLLITDSIKAKL